jgi:predicted porin
LRGNEDLGGGLRTLFTIEMGFAPDTGTLQQASSSASLGQSAASAGRVWGREAHLSLQGAWGTLTAGRQYTLAHQLSGRFQPQSNPNDAALSVLSGHHVARQDNMLKLSVPVGPVNVLASWTANEGNGRAAGLGASWTTPTFELVAYGSDMKTNAAGADTRRIRGLGGSVAVTPDTRVYLGLMTRAHEVSLQKNRVWTTGVNQKLGGALSLTAGYTEDTLSGSASGERRVAFVGLGYALSKRTDAYAEVDQNRVSGGYALPSFMLAKGTQTGSTVGLRHRF